MTVSRRSFLKAGLAAASVALPAAGVRAVEYDSKMKWDKTVDVVIVGYGGAGACAAIEAHDAGAKVLVLEKMHEGGGNTAVSSGGFMVPKDADEAYKYLAATYAFADSEKDEELLQTFCKEIMGVKAFIEGLKPETKLMVYGHAGFKTLPGSDTIDKYRIRGKKRGGDMLFDQFRYAVEEVRKVEVMYETPALELVRRNGEVVGVVAQSKGKKLNICAKRAVVLTTGGYEYDEQSLRNFALGSQIQGLGSPGNTGDGLRMAQTMGARLWHMTSYSCPIGMKVPGLKSAVQLNILAPSHIWVDQDGKRFVNEKGLDNHTCLYAVNQMDPIRHRYPRIPCYLIMDEKARKAGPISGGATSGYALNREGYKWSRDNSAEVESGVLVKADTIAELAKKINVPEDALVASVDRWNKDIANGKDTEFGRILKRDPKGKTAFAGREAPVVSEPLGDGPYYAVALYPTMLNTQGGPKKNVKGQVMDPQDKPIARLYAAGELGSMWGSIYQGATNNAECIVYGRIAGREAAKQKAWS
ncbi:MAG: FAD-binding protein [Sutterellaceae bacterium]|nr:FAD-binding protein [Sutterellaceae bacterium]